MRTSDINIQGLIEGNQKDFKILFDNTHRMLFHRVFKIVRSETVAHDIVQDAFLKFWEKRAELKTDGNPEALLSTIAVRLSIDQYRKDKRYSIQSLETDHWQQIPDTQLENSSSVGQSEKVHVAIEALPPKRRLIFRLCKEENLSYKEIAAHMDISVKTVENQMSKAFKQLRQMLKPAMILLLLSKMVTSEFFVQSVVGVFIL